MYSSSSQAARRRIRGSQPRAEVDIKDIDWIEHDFCGDKRLIGPFGSGAVPWGAGLLCNMVSAASAYNKVAGYEPWYWKGKHVNPGVKRRSSCVDSMEKERPRTFLFLPSVIRFLCWESECRHTHQHAVQELVFSQST